MRIARAGATRPVVLREQAHHEARRAIATLRATARSHGLLNFSQFSIGRQSFDGVYFVPRGHRRQHQATIYRAVFASARSIRHQNHGARAALAFRATFLRARQSLRANVIEKRGLNANAVDGNRAIIE